MLTKHLTDDEIQLYALDDQGCEIKIIEHIRLCSQCKARAEAYQLLFTGIKQQPEPSFNFDLSALVLAQLPSPSAVPSRNNLAVYLFIFIGIVLMGALFYIFRDYAIILFAGIASLVIYLILTTVLTILAALCFDLYKNYQKKMEALDFY
jgi:hypothetical protein